MRFLSLFALRFTPLIVRAQKVDLIHLDPQPAVSGVCPARVHFTGRIRTNGPLDVTYPWLRSDGSHTEHHVHFARASSQNIATDFATQSEPERMDAVGHPRTVPDADDES
jgi:hypothetical protein